MRLILVLLLSSSCLQAAVPLPGLRENIIYLESSQSNQLVRVLSSSSSINKTVLLGRGQFTLPSGITIEMIRNVHVKGIGPTQTIITGNAGDIIWPADNCTFEDLCIRGTIPVHWFNEATNVTFINCWIDGVTDCFYFDPGLTRVGAIARVKGCRLDSGFDFFFMQFSNRDAFCFVEDCSFYGDVIRCSAAQNPARALQPFTGSGGSFYVKDCGLVMSNALNSRLFSFQDAGSAGFNGVFQDVTMSHIITNGGIATVYFFPEPQGTNSTLSFLNVPQFEVATNAAIYTNGYGPTTVYMTATTARTNWLPDIGFRGLPRYDFVVTVKDAAGNAGANNISIRTAGLGTIDGAAFQTINANYGAITVRPRGTNWTVISRGQ